MEKAGIIKDNDVSQGGNLMQSCLQVFIFHCSPDKNQPCVGKIILKRMFQGHDAGRVMCSVQQKLQTVCFAVHNLILVVQAKNFKPSRPSGQGKTTTDLIFCYDVSQILQQLDCGKGK